MGAPGLDVDASRPHHVVVADPMDAGLAGGAVDQVAHCPGPALAVAPSPFGDRHGVGH